MRLYEEEGRVATVGLTNINHPDLTMRATTRAEVEDARGILFWLAAYLVTGGARLCPGDTYELNERLLRIRATPDQRLEVEECFEVEMSAQWRPEQGLPPAG